MLKLTAKGCGPQLLDYEPLPQPDWPLAAMNQIIQRAHQTIKKGEHSLACVYWRLGYALTLVRRQIPRGRWQQYLEEQGMEKTRCSKARAIYRTFSNVQALAGKSVDAAYQQRRRKNKAKTSHANERNNSKDSSASQERESRGSISLLEAFERLNQQAQDWFHEAAFAKSDEIMLIRSALKRVIAALQEIQVLFDSEKIRS